MLCTCGRFGAHSPDRCQWLARLYESGTVALLESQATQATGYAQLGEQAAGQGDWRQLCLDASFAAMQAGEQAVADKLFKIAKNGSGDAEPATPAEPVAESKRSTGVWAWLSKNRRAAELRERKERRDAATMRVPARQLPQSFSGYLATLREGKR